MEHKSIYLDGVDVSACKGLKYKSDGIKKPICLGGGIRGIYRSCLCENNQNCYFKQLARKTQIIDEIEEVIKPYQEPIELDALSLPTAIKNILERKTQECEQIQEKYEALKLENQEGYEIVDELKQECEELKKQKKILKSWSKHLEQWKDELFKENDRYCKALEEIEAVCLEDTRTFADGTQVRYDSLDEILDIISKVKGEECN